MESPSMDDLGVQVIIPHIPERAPCETSRWKVYPPAPSNNLDPGMTPVESRRGGLLGKPTGNTIVLICSWLCWNLWIHRLNNCFVMFFLTNNLFFPALIPIIQFWDKSLLVIRLWESLSCRIRTHWATNRKRMIHNHWWVMKKPKCTCIYEILWACSTTVTSTMIRWQIPVGLG